MLNSQRGDTIVEVIVACAVFAMVTVSSFAIMQRGTSLAYDALERTEVRLQLNAQIETLQYIRDGYIANKVNSATYNEAADLWTNIVSKDAETTEPATDFCLDPASVPSSAFYISDGRAIMNSFQASDGLPQPGQGIWIQRVNSPSGAAVKYYDFYVMSCWPSTTSTQQTMSSVVRLYAAN